MKFILLITTLLISSSMFAQRYSGLDKLVIQVNSPTSIKATYKVMGTADSLCFAFLYSKGGNYWGIKDVNKTAVTGKFVLVNDTVGSNITNGANLVGNIAVVYYGGTYNGTAMKFKQKMINVQAAGAAALIIIAATDTEAYPGGDSDAAALGITIPMFVMKNTDGKILAKTLKTEEVTGYVGAKQIYKNDLLLDVNKALTPARLTNVSLLAQANDIVDTLGIVVTNNGTDVQDSVMCEVLIKYGEDILHHDYSGLLNKDESGNIITTIAPGKSIGYIKFKPFKNNENLKPGKYTITYRAFSTIKSKVDEYEVDNTITIPFCINDSIYSPTVIENWNSYKLKDSVRDANGKPVVPIKLIYDTIRYVNQPFFTTFFQPSVAFTSFGQCLVFRDANASRIKGTGLTFVPWMYSATTQKEVSLKDEPFKISVYEWADKFTGFNDTANFKFNNLIPLVSDQVYVSKNTSSWAYETAKFDDQVLFENDKRYLICVQSSNPNVRFGFDTLTGSLSPRTLFYDQPLNMTVRDGSYKPSGFGLDKIPSIALTVQERKFESSEKELLSFGLKAPDSTKVEMNFTNINIQVPKGTDLTKLAATFTSSEKSKVYVNGVLQVSGVTVNNFANNTVQYVVVAEDGSKKWYYVTVNYCTLKYSNIYLSQEVSCPNQEINFSFSGMNSDLIKEKNWNFGNGKYFTQNNPYSSVQTSYDKKGTYTVSVSYINTQCFNSLDTTSVQVTISDTLHPNADFYLSKTSFCPNEPFSVSASSYNEVSYTWDMGDKTIYTGTTINHAYKEEWNNTIKLTVKNACGNTSTTSKNVKVNKNASANDNSYSYIYSSDVACIGEPITFNTSGNFQSILWNFKDNSANETTLNPTHSFKSAGEYLVQAKLTDYCGVSKTIDKTITIKSSMPFNNIQSLNDYKVCPSEKVYLYYNQYSSSIKSYTWLLPNNEIVQGQNVEKTFAEGENTVYLKLTNYCGNDTMLTTKVSVTRNIPISTYNAFNENQDSEFCPNEEFSIRYNSTGIKSYTWIGQGLVNQENGYAGYFKLSKYGEYSMQLKLTSFCGKDTILTKKITIVNNKPIEDQFSYYTFNKSYCPGEEVYFSKMNSDNYYKLQEYEYGDGDKGTSNTHRYDAFGEYTVQLKLTNYCDIDTTIQATVHIAPVSISPSTSIYVSGNNSMQEEIYCQFDEISFGISDYQGASIKSVIWNFGDGTPEVDNSNPTHIFAKSGLLTVKARLTSYCGDTLTIFKKISTRSDVGYKGYINENIPNAVCPGESANFSLNTDFKAVAWDFGDKTQSTAKNAVHSYAKMGTYPITLKLTNNCNVDTILNYSVEVRNDVAPDIDLDVLANVICPGEKIVFFQSNDSRDYQISYDFGDNTKDYTLVDSIAHYSASILSHKYTSKGTYQMKLTAKNKCGLTATSSETITVQDGLKLDVNADIDGENVTEDTLLFVLNTGGSEFTWNFGKNDIVKTDVGFIKHGFSSTGDKNISVFVKTTCGDTGTYHAQVTITKVTTIANVTSCGNYLWKNKVYTQSGTYSNVFTNKQGFDSIVTLQLTIYAPSKSTTVYKAKGSYTWNGVQYTQSGVYTFTTKNVHGCDSVATLELTIESQGTSTISIATCGSYAWNGKKYTQSGSYTYTTKNAQGNDSIATLLLTILPATSSSTNFTANGVYTWNDNTYSTSGVYTFTSKNVNGCDSIATLVLTIVAPGKSTTVVSACDSYTWNGKNYIQSGVYTFSTKTNSGADSTATLLLTISTSSSTSFNHTACGNYVWNGMSYTKSGKYVVTAKNTKGCDSTITLNLIINEVPSVLTGIQNGSLFATQTNATYQWLNCEVNNSAVKDATNQAFLPTQTGSYAVQVTKNGCVDTSSCISFETQSTSGIKDVQEARFTIYPNPNQGVFQIAGLPTGTYKILNLMGAVVFDFTVENSDVQLLNLSHLAKGVYQVASEDIKIMHNKVVITD